MNRILKLANLILYFKNYFFALRIFIVAFVSLVLIAFSGIWNILFSIDVFDDNLPIKAEFKLKTNICYVNKIISFEDASLGSPDFRIWSFGDGSISYEKDPLHIYKKAGLFSVSLMIKRANFQSTITKNLIILDYKELAKKEESLKANFVYDPPEPRAGVPVRFYDKSIGEIESRIWQFGYFGLSKEINPIKIFYKSGKYQISLTIKNKNSMSTFKEIVNVFPGPKDIIVAKSCSFKDVQAAIAQANAGDTVLVPAGRATWTSKLKITKGIILKGAGIDQTIIDNGYNNPSDYDECLIMYYPSDFSANWPFRITGFTFNSYDKSNTIKLAGHKAGNDLTIQNKIRIDHNKFTAELDNFNIIAIVNNGMRGVIDNNLFYHTYAIRHEHCAKDGGQYWWNNLEGVRFGKEDNNMYYEDNIFYDVTLVSNCQYANRYVFRYNTIYMRGNPYSLFDMHGNQDADHGNMWSSFGGEIYGNMLIAPTSYFNFRFFDHRGGRALVFMNVTTASSGAFELQVRDEYPDSDNPENNPDYQFPNDSYYFLNRRGYTGSSYITVIEGEHSDNPPLYRCPMRDRDYFVGTDNFNGSSGVGYGTLSNRPISPTLVGVSYWATEQNISDLRGMVGKNPTTPISGVLYKCTAPGEWTAYFTPLTYPHPLRNILGE